MTLKIFIFSYKALSQAFHLLLFYSVSCEHVFFDHSLVSDSLQPHGRKPDRFLCLGDFSGKNTRVGGYFLLQGIFPTWGSNPCLLHRHVGSFLPSHLRSPLVPQPPNTEARVKQQDQTTPRGSSENSSSTQHTGGRALRPGPGGAGHCTLCLVNMYLVWYVANVLEFQNGTLFGTRVCAIYITKLR